MRITDHGDGLYTLEYFSKVYDWTNVIEYGYNHLVIDGYDFSEKYYLGYADGEEGLNELNKIAGEILSRVKTVEELRLKLLVNNKPKTLRTFEYLE